MKNYHVDDQDDYGQNVWGCTLCGAGTVGSNHVRPPIGIGLFVDWKMSGSYYNNYADYRVGSPITTHYHKWSTSNWDWYGPILRIGGSHEYLHECGPFDCMYSRLETALYVFGSVILVFYTNY